MSDNEFLTKIAELWIELCGDSEGVSWSWEKLQRKVAELEALQREEDKQDEQEGLCQDCGNPILNFGEFVKNAPIFCYDCFKKRLLDAQKKQEEG
jgi:protein-arginine kinase activator protein McsA